jgi:phosphoglycerate dehydrogenase-like enzyme
MKKVVSTVGKARFDKYQVHFPSDWEVIYVDVPYTDETLIEACKKADYLFVGSIHKVDVASARSLNIPVCNNRAVNNGAVAEHTIGLILAAMRRTALCNAQIVSEGYAACKKEHLAQGEHELAGKHVGLIGIGAIGKEVAKRLIAWECHVSYFDVFRPSAEVEKALGVDYMELDDLIRKCDIISAHVPVMESTYNMLNAERFSQMKDGAIVINTARGEIVDQEALADALESEKIAAAALDTIYPEPAPPDHPLLNLSAQAQKRLILTPHVGGMTDEAFTRMLRNAIANFIRVENGEQPVNVVNNVD